MVYVTGMIVVVAVVCDGNRIYYAEAKSMA